MKILKTILIKNHKQCVKTLQNSKNFITIQRKCNDCFLMAFFYKKKLSLSLTNSINNDYIK